MAYAETMGDKELSAPPAANARASLPTPAPLTSSMSSLAVLSANPGEDYNTQCHTSYSWTTLNIDSLYLSNYSAYYITT